MRKNLQTILLNHLSTLAKVASALMLCLIISLQSGYSQEVDRGRSNKKKLRETRFKTRNKQGDRIHKGDITGRKKKRKKTKNKNKITSPSSTPYSSPFYGNKDRRKESRQVQKTDGYFNRPSRTVENYRKGDISGRKTRKSITRTGESKTVQAPANPYAGRKEQTERRKAKTSRAHAGRFQSITISRESKPQKHKRRQPRTASRTFVTRKKVNAYAGKPHRGEKAKIKDIAGRNIRSKNFKSRSQSIVKPSFDPYFSRKRKEDRAHTAVKGTGYVSVSKEKEHQYRGRVAGGYSTATKKGEKSWRKDITGRNFRRSADPGVVTGKKGISYTGTQNRTLSISGDLKNNNKRALVQKPPGPGTDRAVEFSGRYKLFELSADFDTRPVRFQGNMKGSRKPLKGGGSISTNIWQGRGRAMMRKDPGSLEMSGFSGNMKGSRKPLKGWGSISRNTWNNQHTPLQKKSMPLQNFNASKFKGRFTLFEISPGFMVEDVGKYKGTLKMKNRYRDKPHAVENTLKVKEPPPRKNIVQMSGARMKDHRNFRKKPNAHEDALKTVAPQKAVAKSEFYVPKYAKVKYAKKPNAHEDAMKGIRPENNTSKATAFQGNFKNRKNYDRKMHPDPKYTTSLHRKNSVEEKHRAFKFNMWWAKLFKKTGNQPHAVKEKVRTPRYDKREKDLWYD